MYTFAPGETIVPLSRLAVDPQVIHLVGRKLSHQAILRWSTVGCKRGAVKLPVRRLPACLGSSIEAVRWFIDQLNIGNASALPCSTGAAHARAAKELEAAGITKAT